MKKRFISLLLAAALCVGLLPAGAFALEAPAEPEAGFEAGSAAGLGADAFRTQRVGIQFLPALAW